MDEPVLKVAVGLDRGGWHNRFVEAIEGRMKDVPSLRCFLVNMDRSDWLAQIGDASLILWKPPYMGHEFAGYVKEKVYFLEHYLGRTVLPNFSTVWHFESKVAQSYLFELLNADTPHTFVSFDLDESMDAAGRSGFPVVRKKPAGAGSTNVRAVRDLDDLRRDIERTFSFSLWDRFLREKGRLGRIAGGIRHRWFRDFLWRKLLRTQLFGVEYWQEFIPGNDSDLRITVIGDRFATGFWRRNRPGDFRASGSGNIDYDTPLPEEAIRLCLGISRRLDFDSMAYDILLRDGKPVISEMSYGYSDVAVYRVSGYSVLEPDGSLSFVDGHTWPQALWVDWALIRAERKLTKHGLPGAAGSESAKRQR